VLSEGDLREGDLEIVRQFAGPGVPLHKGTPAGVVEDTRHT
jgi:hypothetical protein